MSVRDALPFLQIVHGAELSLWSTHAHENPWPAMRALARGLIPSDASRARKLLPEPHDPRALRAFHTLLEQQCTVDTTWRRVPTWLALSGSGTALGDPMSHRMFRSTARSLAVSSGARSWLTLRGERDQWPGTHPTLANDEAIEAARYRCELGSFPTRFPVPPFSVRSPNGALEVQLFALDVAPPPTRSFAPNTAQAIPEELARLSSLAELYDTHEEDHIARMRVLVLQESVALPRSSRAPHLLLTGPSSSHPVHTPQWSLPAPLLKRTPPEERSGCTQACQLLRFWYAPSRPRSVRVERWLAVRFLGLGPFSFVPGPDGSAPYETLHIDV